MRTKGRSELVCAAVAGAFGLSTGSCGGGATSDESVAQVSQAIKVPSLDPDDVEDAIEAATAGQKVVFPCHIVDGKQNCVYELDEAIQFKSGVAFVGDENGQTVLKWSGASTLRLEHEGSEAVSNVTIKNLTFENIGINFVGDAGNITDSSNLYLKNLTFKGGKGDGWAGKGYVTAKYTDGVVIDGCTFLRSKKDEGGRGIRSYLAHNTIIKDSFIGTTKHLPDGAPDGWFRVGINVLNNWSGVKGDPQSKNVKVANTVLRRFHNPDCSIRADTNDDGDTMDETCLSHGIYAVWYDGLELTNNWVDGFAPDLAENSAKLRNSDNTFVFGNHFMRSGLHLFTDTGKAPNHLRNLHVRGNRFDISECDAEEDATYCGIRLAREAISTDEAEELPEAEWPDEERDIYLADNTFANLGIIQVADTVHGPEVCVQNNAGATNDFEATGVRTSGCSPGSGDRPLAGVFSGDFNEDGIKDTATRVQSGGTGFWTWRVYASDGDRYQMLDFGDGARVTAETGKYGVHVGDFTGNGKDDIIYYGECFGAPCWVVQASQGTSFETKTGFGDGMFSSDETVSFGVHVGDFDGDKKDDLVYRGKCGSPAVPCWRVHKSTGTTFTVHNFGNDASWYEGESALYGLMIGNFDGDAAGLDDIAYLGKCGSSRCIRVHLSTGSAFAYQPNWDQGAGVLRDGPEITEHFGMRVGDMNGDGRADIGYRGRCGTDNKQWRYHKTKSTGDGFVIVCKDTYEF